MFKPDTLPLFCDSFKISEACLTVDKANIKFPECNNECVDGKVGRSWSGSFTAKDGTVMRASFWDWKGSLARGYVSIWTSNRAYISEFRQYIEA